MLSFDELEAGGVGLEQLVRELLLLLDFHPQWSGVGPDGGKDLLFDEFGSEVLGTKSRRWLVSCKDFAQSGRAVGVSDIDGLVESCQQHDAAAFLLVCTTRPSSGVVDRLTRIDSNRALSISTHVWDGVTLERLLSTPRGWAITQRAMPESAARAGWKIFGTVDPHRWVAVHRGHYFHLSNRVASGLYFDLESLDQGLQRIDSLELPDDHRLRVRGIWDDDAHAGGYTWYIDYVYPSWNEGSVVYDVGEQLESGSAWSDSQFHFLEVEFVAADYYSDHFDIDHHRYYRRLPPFV